MSSEEGKDWVLVSDKLPELKQRVLVSERYEDSIYIAVLRQDHRSKAYYFQACEDGLSVGGDGYFDNNKIYLEERLSPIEYWMPLPKKPEKLEVKS